MLILAPAFRNALNQLKYNLTCIHKCDVAACFYDDSMIARAIGVFEFYLLVR